MLADSHGALRVLETASPPAFYLPPGDVAVDLLHETSEWTECEWKGRARQLDLGDVRHAAWVYPDTYPEFAPIAGFVSFHPARVRCAVAGEQAGAQPGGYYGGWVTAEVVGPFKGGPGSARW